MCCMCLLVGSPKISAHMIGIGGWLHLSTQVTSCSACYVAKFLSPEFSTNFQRKVPCFVQVLKFPYNTV